jgi:hypothetical protein
MEWWDEDGPRCWNCDGWGDCFECAIDDYGFIRDEFLDKNGNYYKYKKFLLDQYDSKNVTLWSHLDDFGNGFAYIHHKYHRLSIDNSKVVLTLGYNPKPLQVLVSRTLKKNSIPNEYKRICDMIDERFGINIF